MGLFYIRLLGVPTLRNWQTRQTQNSLFGLFSGSHSVSSKVVTSPDFIGRNAVSSRQMPLPFHKALLSQKV